MSAPAGDVAAAVAGDGPGRAVRLAVHHDAERGVALVRPLDAAGAPVGPVHMVVPAGLDLRGQRAVWRNARTYRALLAAGVRAERAHDVELVEGLLVGADGAFGAPHGLAAAAARLAGGPVPPDEEPEDAADEPPALFRRAEPDPTATLDSVVAVHAAQQRRLAADPRLRTLAAAESAGGIVAEEMRAEGLPWRADVHDALLTEALGPRPTGHGRPPRLAALAAEVEAAFGRPVNPDSPAELLRAFARAGFELPSTRSWVIKRVDHPAVAPLLAYKDLARLHAAHGWNWLRTWVHEGRFRPEYVVGGVVSGRWATRGGGALQIPKTVRAAVRADDGCQLVVADAAQLEPRILAAIAADAALARAGGTERDSDLYAGLAAELFGPDVPNGRAKAKLAVLSAIYGQTSGDAGAHLALLRRRFPAAVAVVEEAARAGEEGRLVRSWLGRTCPPARPGDEVPARARARGRFTRNFVVQATAAEWALVLLAELRSRLGRAGNPSRLVFFQHDEVMLHGPADAAPEAAELVQAAADSATRTLFGATPVRVPMPARVVESYAEK
ncbi:bifunctional 3'-5' exonuclease/DNA polymerase [Pseudonocardia sp. RS11V-5]|uniref:bifunctional 3'-5' exonuclease/DNA polymerase n=1 Tax=Pseudonocardia terrae TaxID=2905831 RepID=UPI001E51AC1C|nr:bifunctional 3'-5' exonuclease/DNA polymerase [Pseudonocardia terrae]MCE3550081.1 bifunctional 3'-5' exonuclease/DNA polymerase [Pseudonocardia terrae]